MNRDCKVQGEWAEVSFTARAMGKGLRVAKPYGDSAPYDFIVEAGSRFLRIQVKSVSVETKKAYRVSTGRGFHAKLGYTAGEVDFFAAWVIPHDAWYIIPVQVVAQRVSLHLCPHRPSHRNCEAYKEAWHLLREPI